MHPMNKLASSIIRTYIAVTFLLLSTIGKTQAVDSTWLADKFLPQFYVDTGTSLPVAKLVDEEGHERTLADFKGRILYLDIWATWCGNCIGIFPYQEQLLKRLKVLHLDTAIQFLNISIEDKKSDWKKALKKYKPIGINLYSTDTSLYEHWNMAALPTYLLLDTSGKVLGKDISSPDDATIDYILYAATRGIHPVQAVWTEFRQEKLFSEQRTPAAFTDEDYAKWHASIMPSLIDFHFWKQAHTKKK